MAAEKTTHKPAEQNPQRGGSYVRHEDGSLEQREATKPAQPQMNANPPERAPDQE